MKTTKLAYLLLLFILAVSITFVYLHTTVTKPSTDVISTLSPNAAYSILLFKGDTLLPNRIRLHFINRIVNEHGYEVTFTDTIVLLSSPLASFNINDTIKYGVQ